jgi:malate/lactate dehydrogenase
MESVYCAVCTESLHDTDKFHLQRVKQCNKKVKYDVTSKLHHYAEHIPDRGAQKVIHLLGVNTKLGQSSLCIRCVTEKLQDQNNAKAWFVVEVCLKNYRTKIIPESGF